MRLKVFLLAVMLVLLAGCGIGSEEELYALPQLSSDNEHLQVKLNEIRAAGGEYSAPRTGSNVQSVQRHDLNGDGIQEAVAFFRFVNDEKPLKIYIFQLNEKEEYDQIGLIEGEGNDFYSVIYENVAGDERKELVVTWQLASATATRLLTIHALGKEGSAELIRTHYTSFQALDIDKDGLTELVVIQLDGENSRAELYRADGEVVQLSESAPLSTGIGAIRSVRTARLREYQSAVFVFSLLEDGNLGDSNFVTDVFAWQNGSFKNITYLEEASVSQSTVVPIENVTMTDINGDGIMELPFPYQMPKVNRPGVTEQTYWGIQWRQLDKDGNQYATISTFHNINDGWYLQMPNEWEGNIHIARDDTILNIRTVTFSYYLGEGREPQPFLKIYRYTGTSQSRATTGNRFKLLESPLATYSAEFIEGGWDCGLDETSLLEAFCLIQDEWQ